MSSFLFIVNPVSGKGRGKKAISKINDWLLSNKLTGKNYEIIESEYHGHIIKIAQSKSSSFDNIIAVGGDGTVNEVVNGIYLSGSNPNFGVLPVGSGNDFVKNIYNGKLSLTNILDILVTSERSYIKDVDIGLVNFTNFDSSTREHIFINSIGLGFDAQVAFINQHNKLLSGVPSYILAVIRALFDFKMLKISVMLDNQETLKSESLLITLGNGISSGGGFYLTPDGLIDDGILNATIIEKVSRKRLLIALPKALVNKVREVKEVSMYKTKYSKIVFEDPCYMHCDGEVISSKVKSIEIKLLNKRIKVITNK